MFRRGRKKLGSLSSCHSFLLKPVIGPLIVTLCHTFYKVSECTSINVSSVEIVRLFF